MNSSKLRPDLPGTCSDSSQTVPRPTNIALLEAGWVVGGHLIGYSVLSVADGTTLLDTGQMNLQNSDSLSSDPAIDCV